ncbi:hypothetical protein HRD49_42875 [Corallococcus exiguus]|uniref:alpha/beta fold hydrolase n=1 Tax=Corallococcus TaxID=83461 RepID=UPI001315656B|nr:MULTISPECIES: hypothetical protein [Corallococcus]NNC21741.1 hypothetical protein [Corallococcus exiguus]NRD57497.1 hypothetical protein [Corallococcus exiguus]NRD68490.1 hypothetical protein [Corallococcus exiguus]
MGELRLRVAKFGEGAHAALVEAGTLLGMMETFLREIGAVADLPMGVERFLAVDTATLVLLGDQSPQVLLAEPAHALAKVLPHASLRVLPRHGHVAHVSAPALLAREVEDFLSAR